MSREHILTFPRLDGGLNLSELDYRMESDQSPEMKNLCWRDGVLSSRDGQEWLTEENLGTGYAAYGHTFRGAAFFHAADGIYALPMEGERTALPVPRKLMDGVPENGGTFFLYGGSLFYKNRGGYYRIDGEEDSFTAECVAAYTPIVRINADPSTGAGDLYQSENRLSPQKTIWYTTMQGVKEYHLGVENVQSIDAVEVDGEVVTDFTADLTTGTVTFNEEPAHHDPVLPNTVRITYSRENPEAYRSVMDCPYAVSFGGNQNVCVVVGGSTAQPNAYFWSGNHAAMDPGYFPMEQYNLAGATEEPVTGFGKQQNMLVIFKESSVGRAVMGTLEMDTGRVMLTMDYTAINDRIGCDLPGTIQLIGNNLVFCNTKQGVHILRDSSTAHENNILCISGNVNGTDQRPGLLAAVRREGRACSFDDDTSYWVCSDGEAYVWDYSISSYQKPSWFYHTGIHAAAFFRSSDLHCHLNGAGRVTVFRRVFGDYGEAIHKVYRFAAQFMGGYDRLKNITSVLFTVRSDTDTVIHITYQTDYETRQDLTPIRAYSWRMVPRNLAYRYLGVRRFATVAKRRPICRHVRHFSMKLENCEFGADMSVVSAEIFFQYRGRER